MSLILRVCSDRRAAELTVADELSALLRERGRAGSRVVLGLPTGGSPKGLYAELVRRHRDDGLSFRHVTPVLLDEFWPLAADHPASFRRFLREHLLDHVDVAPDALLALDGTLAEADVAGHCAALEDALASLGGIDVVLLGIGRTGHLGFNEPGSPADSRTRRVTLHDWTREDTAPAFGGIDGVPRHALTLGLGTILEARHVRVLAFGASKAHIVARAVDDPVTERVPASLLHRHADAAFVLDPAAAGALLPTRP